MVIPFVFLFPACTAGSASGTDKDDVPTWSDTSAPDSEDTRSESDSGDTASDTGTAPPPDLDGDGHVDIAAGGDDCDDRNDTVYPGAEEWCDPVDHDCNGEILEDGVCGKVQSGMVISPVAYTGSVASPTLVDDVTGDGWPDLVACSTTGTLDQPQAFLFDQLPDSATVTTDPSEVAARIWIADNGYGGVDPEGNLEAGDLDGDGIGELSFVNSLGMAGYLNFHGPISTGGVESTFGEYDSAWTPAYTYGTYGTPSAGKSDYDGDGLADVAGTFFDLDSGRNYVSVHFGGTGQYDYVSLGPYYTETLANPGDADGDGLDDLAFGQSGLHFVSGNSLRESDGSSYTEASFLTIETGSSPYLVLPADYTEDGVADFVVGDQTHDGLAEYGGAMFWFDGTARGRQDEQHALGSLFGDEDHLTGVQAFGDADGDGRPELLLSSSGGTRVLPGDIEIPRSGTPVYEPRQLMVATLFLAPGREGTTSRDFNRDGYPDIGMYDRERQIVGIWAGWDIPWDEDRYW